MPTLAEKRCSRCGVVQPGYNFRRGAQCNSCRRVLARSYYRRRRLGAALEAARPRHDLTPE